MIAQRKASVNAHVYAVGHKVKISTRVLRPSQAAEPNRKMAPLYLGPYTVTKLLGPKTLSVDLPAEYAVNNAFNFEDVRPWFDHESHSYESDYPVSHVQAHDTVNRILAVVNRRRLPGRLPADTDYLDIPCEFQVLRLDRTVEWPPSSASVFEDPTNRKLLIAFEMRYRRDPSRPCNPVEDYPDELDPGYESPDELPLALAEDIDQRLR